MSEEDSMFNVMLGTIFLVAGIAVLIPTLQRMFPVAQLTQYLQAQSYQGLTDDRVLNATPTMQWLNLISAPPYNPWVTAYFFNDGPHSVFIAINNPNELTQLASGEEKLVDMTGAIRRIELVFYKTNLGERASVRVEGKY